MKTPDSALGKLFQSLDKRWRPETVATHVTGVLPLSTEELNTIRVALKADQENHWFFMSDDFQRPVDMTRQLKIAEKLFGLKVNCSPDDVQEIEAWLQDAEETIGKTYGKNDFQGDRLNKADRLKIGVDISRRQYNKLFRLSARMEKKALRLAKEQFKRSLTLASKNRLAANIRWEDFSADENTACFIAYYVSRCNLRSVFTNTSQLRAYDDICEMLMQRCQKNPTQTNWWAVAHVLPASDVLQHLDDEQKGVLMADYFGLMHDAAKFLKELWEQNDIRDDLIVQHGNDSTTWNITAGAWNKLREGWLALMYELNMADAVKKMCPGKVLRLMAADVAAWHRRSGGGLHPDTAVFRELPFPWEVLSGQATCSRTLVETVCRNNRVNPVKSGWTMPRPDRKIEQFTPTPELVHGVTVASPLLASIFRKAGVFSGKQQMSTTVPLTAVNEIRSRHHLQQEQRKQELESDEETSVM